ncbi:MAG: quinone-dependent dihydroorotate dehydrogenase [Salinivirgaceae bacterium]
MYKRLIRPLFFRCNPETAHAIVFFFFRIIRFFYFKKLVSKIYNRECLQMETEVCGIKFPNKIGVAAGFDKNAEVYDVLESFGFGHVEIGTVTPLAQKGNPKPRLFRLPADNALINRMGFNNNGLESAIERLKKRNSSLIIGGNIGKNTLTPNQDAINDYRACFTGLYPYVDYLVVNVSCPNISDLHKLQDQEELELLLNELMHWRTNQSVKKPVFLKISPDLNPHQLDETLDVVERLGVDGVVVSNTSVTRQGLTTPEEDIIRIANGGLSGKPLTERSTELIAYINDKTQGKLPIIGVGGVFTPEDALDKLKAGASLVQVYTGFIYEGPGIAKRINKKLLNALQK